MNAQEAVLLCRYAKAACPQQAIDQYTPDIWHDLIGELELEECRRAIATIAKRQIYVAPAEIHAQVMKQRGEILSALAPPVPPRELADDPRRENAWIGEWRRAVVAGATTQEAEASAHQLLGTQPPELDEVRDIKAITERIGRGMRDRKSRPRDEDAS